MEARAEFLPEAIVGTIATLDSRAEHADADRDSTVVTPRILTCAAALLVGALVTTTSAMAQTRGELLYTTHCISCHTTQVHWRDSRAATNWSSLMFQVRRWQGVGSLGWTDSDILDVARYLNESIYRFDQTDDPRSSLSLYGVTNSPQP